MDLDAIYDLDTQELRKYLSTLDDKITTEFEERQRLLILTELKEREQGEAVLRELSDVKEEFRFEEQSSSKVLEPVKIVSNVQDDLTWDRSRNDAAIDSFVKKALSKKPVRRKKKAKPKQQTSDTSSTSSDDSNTAKSHHLSKPPLRTVVKKTSSVLETSKQIGEKKVTTTKSSMDVAIDRRLPLSANPSPTVVPRRISPVAPATSTLKHSPSPDLQVSLNKLSNIPNPNVSAGNNVQTGHVVCTVLQPLSLRDQPQLTLPSAAIPSHYIPSHPTHPPDPMVRSSQVDKNRTISSKADECQPNSMLSLSLEHRSDSKANNTNTVPGPIQNASGLLILTDRSLIIESGPSQPQTGAAILPEPIPRLCIPDDSSVSVDIINHQNIHSSPLCDTDDDCSPVHDEADHPMHASSPENIELNPLTSSSSLQNPSTSGNIPTTPSIFTIGRNGTLKDDGLRSRESLGSQDTLNSNSPQHSASSSDRTMTPLEPLPTSLSSHREVILALSETSNSTRRTDGSTDREKPPPTTVVCCPDYHKLYKCFHNIFAALYQDEDAQPHDIIKVMQEQLQRFSTPWVAVTDDGQVPCDSNTLLFRVVQDREEVYDIVTRSAEELDGWRELSPAAPDIWNVLWTWTQPHINFSDLLVWQRVNHFPKAKQLSRKDLLKKNLMRYRSIPGRLGDEFDIFPITFTLPREYVQFVDEFSKRAEVATENDPNLWIMKPVGLSRGRGIVVLDDISQVTYGDAVVIQRYLASPLLLDGFKFDLRLYILVTSFSPLEAFIYKEGFGRFSTQKYSTDPKSLTNRYIHLTNSSVQKNRAYGVANRMLPSSGGTKCSLNFLWGKFKEVGIDVEALWTRIIDVVLRSLFCVTDVIPSNPNSFELFGYDVLIDSSLKPWLIEVNSSPSLAVENKLDEEVKVALVKDIFKVIHPLPFDRNSLVSVLKRRLADRSRHRFSSSAQQQISNDINSILAGSLPRARGTPPDSTTNFSMIAPSTAYTAICSKFNRKNGAEK